MSVILCGCTCSGKTTIAKEYSRKFDSNFLDTDELIISEFYQKTSLLAPIGSIYSSIGEYAFRKLEAAVIKKIPKTAFYIVATGGGTVLNESSVAHLKSLGKIIYIQLSHTQAYSRIMSRKIPPKFINKHQDIDTYLQNRHKVYMAISDHVIKVDDLTPEEISCSINSYIAGCKSNSGCSNK